MQEVEKLTLREKATLLSRLATLPALSLMAWSRPNIGSRLLMPGAGMAALLMFVVCIFIPERNDRILFFGFALLTLLASLIQRFKRWREFRRGVRQHSYFLGNAGCRWWIPNFLCRHRWPERFFEPFIFIGVGLALLRIASITGLWVIASGACIAMTESLARRREEDEQRDIVDGLVKAEVQSGTVERFSDSAPVGNRPARRRGTIPTGLGGDISIKVKRP